MNLKNKRILVTGGSGFIGSSLISKLIKLGANVDNYDSSVGCDIEDHHLLKKYVKRKYNYIFHLAAFSGSARSNRKTLRTFSVNTLATLKLCELIIKYSPKAKLVLSSSRLEYGNPKYLPVDEIHPTEPTTVYGLSKLTSTWLALVCNKKNGLRVTIFRTSNVYGRHPKGKFTGYNIINHFIDLAKKNSDLQIFGKGSQKRDYIYIDDLVSAFILGLSNKANGKVYNLGFGKGISIRNMAKIIIQKVGKGKMKFIKWPQDYKQIETGDYISNISKIKKELGFAPSIGFKEGVKKTLEYNK